MSLLSFLPLVGSFLSGGAGSESETSQNYESTTTGSSTINRTELPPEVLAAMATLFSGGQLEKNQADVQGALTGQLKNVTESQKNPFDIGAYVSGIMKSAENTANNDMAKSINATESSIGGTQSNSSMAALLANRMRTDTAASLAGIKGQATAEGTALATQQQQSGTESIMGLTGAMSKNLTDMLQLFRGAQTTQKQRSKEHTEGEGTSTTSSPFNWMKGLGDAFQGFKMPT